MHGLFDWIYAVNKGWLLAVVVVAAGARVLVRVHDKRLRRQKARLDAVLAEDLATEPRSLGTGAAAPRARRANELSGR